MEEERQGPEPASATEQLLRAAADGDAEGVRALLAEGADVNGVSRSGMTPLIFAAFFGHHEIVRELLAAGARAEAKDDLDLTALDWSIRRGFTKTEKVLRAAPERRREQLQAPGRPSGVNEVSTDRPAGEPPGEPRSAESAISSEVPGEVAPPPAPVPQKVKHCPVCRRTYPDEVRSLCSYHPSLLVKGAPPPAGADVSVPPPEPNKPQRHLQWSLGALTLSAAAILGYAVHSRGSLWTRPRAATESKLVADYPLEVTTASAVGGALKGRQVLLPTPDYPAAARAQRITGSVTVEVTTGKGGRVAVARALDGPEALRAAAEEAARKAKFRDGEGARRSGTVKYDFRLCRDSGECV